MAKTKNKKRNFAEKVNSKKSKNTKSMNPFEIHINREKMKVLGRKAVNDRGMPGISRAKALKKRKNTILQEYKVQNKSNKFMDKRIGEKNPQMSEEERVMARFTAERIKAHKKKSIFNLGEDEVLTHRGQTLSEIEKFDDPRSDDDDIDEDNRTGKLKSDFVEDAHFGGGVLKRTDKEGAKTHRELIDQLILESKKRKVEKQKQKEATLELTEKLDMEWKDLMPIVNQSKKIVDTEKDVHKQRVDDYDKVMRELKFEARGTPSDRLKTEDEVAKEEKEKLEKLEQERLNRMRGFVDHAAKEKTHRSADDLDDDFIYESDHEDNVLSYNEQGESNTTVHAEINGREVSKVSEEKNDSDDEVEENEDEDENDSSTGNGTDDNESESEDNLSDLKEESSDSDMDVTEEESKPDQTTAKGDFKQDLLERKAVMEKAREELPYTFSLPDSYESLQKTLENRPTSHQSVIIERMIKCNHPSLGEKNKENLSMLFVFLMQCLDDLTTSIDDQVSIKKCFEIFGNLVPHIFDLAQLNPENAQQSMIEIIKEKHTDFKKNSRSYPGLDVLIFLKLISCLFSTSDFRHQVVTPSLVFMEQMLNKCKVRGKKDVSYGLFLSTLILEYTTLSKRFLPAVINFLCGIVHMAVPKVGVSLIKVLPPFKSTCTLLVLTERCTQVDASKLDSGDLLDMEIDDDFRIRAFSTAICLLMEYHDNYKELSSNVEIFEPVHKILQLIPKEKYPDVVQNDLNNLLQSIETSAKDRKLEFIEIEAKRPKALRLYEPNIETIYDGKRHKVQSKQKAQRDKLLHKLKKEHKGAVREIRRDKAFLSRLKINQRIKSDVERKEKVKRLYAEAATQQSELKALDRQKKK